MVVMNVLVILIRQSMLTISCRVKMDAVFRSQTGQLRLPDPLNTDIMVMPAQDKAGMIVLPGIRDSCSAAGLSL